MAVEPVEENWPGRERLVIDGLDGPTRPIPVAGEVTAVTPPPPGPPAPLDPRGRSISDQIGLGMILVLALVAVAGAAIAAVLLTRGNDHHGAETTTIVETTPARVVPAASAPVAMPSLVGRSRADATTALRVDRVKLVVAAVSARPPADRVVAQAPPAGQRLRRGQTVRLNVSDGKIPAAPTSTPSTRRAATQSTAPSTTTAEQPTTTTAPQATTTSAAQIPPAQPSTVQVPSLGGDVKDAVQRLSPTGLLTSLQYVPGDDPLGTVRAQSPAADATARTGSHVTLTVSSGPGGHEAETVPDTTGQSVPQALATLNRAGLRLIMLRRRVSDRSLAGRIVEQTPRAGDQAPKNAQVLVYMGAYRG